MTSSKERIDSWFAKAKRPAGISIKPRRLDLKLDDSVPTYWSYNSPFLTAFNVAFSATFPLGERFMIDSVREHRPLVKQHEVLYKECGGFIGQEAHHANEHEALNNFMMERGFPVDKLEKKIKWWTDFTRKRFSTKFQMAISGAAEHLTAMFGDMVLNSPELIESTHEAVRPIMIWHAIEEVEHKAVTHDLYDAVDGSYVRRVLGYLWCLTMSGWFVLNGMVMFLWAIRQDVTVKDTLQGLWWMFGFGKHSGYLIKSFPKLFTYFSFSYHPWKEENSDLLVQWMPELNRMLDVSLTSRQPA
jgi:hypothetical protein